MENKKKIFLVIIYAIMTYKICYGGFYNDRERGWFWHEQLSKQEQLKKQKEQLQQTPENAKRLVEQLKKDIEDSRNIWLEFPTIENATKYRLAEKKMYDKTTKATEAWQMAGILHPELDDNLENPSNIHARRLADENELEKKEEVIRNLAGEIDLVLYTDNSLQASAAFEPVIDRFCNKYGFSMEVITENESNYFASYTKITPELRASLNIRGAPSVFVVHKTLDMSFELISNFTSFSELEERLLVAREIFKKEARE